MALQNLSSSKTAGDADNVVAIAKTAGYVISAEELQKAEVDVSEEELEGVAGGLTEFCWEFKSRIQGCDQARFLRVLS